MTTNLSTSIRYSTILRCLFSTVFVLVVSYSFASPVVVVTNKNENVSIAPFSSELVDKSGTLNVDQLLNTNNLSPTSGFIPIYGLNDNNVWLKFSATNASTSHTLYLNIQYTNLGLITLYEVNGRTARLLGNEGNRVEAQSHETVSPNPIFDLGVKPGESKTFIIHVQSQHPIMLPAFVSTNKGLHTATSFQTIIISLYMGILLIMFLYNLFLYFATKDRNYLLYTGYIFCLILAQLTIAGYGASYLWPNFTWFNRYAVIITSSLSAIGAVIFAISFLQTKNLARRTHKLLLAIIGIYLLGMISPFLGFHNVGYSILNYNGFLAAVTLFIASFYIARKGLRAAYVYLIAWGALLSSFMVLVFRNLNLVPYNLFTAYVFYLGSAIEVALISLALADKINSLRREKEASQAAALEASLENEHLVREQNVVLERKVAERTEELQETNEQLSEAFKELKDAQIQLVEAEKMASLGQLTAGIAHEINNPINFVKSNIKPLQLDFKDMVEIIEEYEQLHSLSLEQVPQHLSQVQKLKQDIDLDFIKTEIWSLLNGVKDGAERTAEIVRGLRTFSRLDESQIKVVNIHEGIESTLVLLRNSCPDHVKIHLDFQAEGNIECFPGKLNQVFMNILSNAIQALKSTGDKSPQFINIRTRDIDGNQIEISIKDSGPGMPPEVKQKIFDPFFTTKDVGEGTGLGLAIVFKIIQEHSGRIEVVSAEGEGAEFIIVLHHNVPEKPIV